MAPAIKTTLHWFSITLTLAAMASCGSVTTKGQDAGNAPDAGGSVDAADNAPDANTQTCTASTVVCDSDVLTVCSAAGMVESTTACALGCFDGTRCNKLDPSNGLATHLDESAAATDTIFVGSAMIDTSNGSITDQNGAVALVTAVDTSGPIDVFIIKVKSLTAANINVVGTRALAIVSDGDITISGVLNVSGNADQNGPGAHLADTTCRGKQGTGSAGSWTGGGGAGFGGPGGSGGSVSAGHAGGLGGGTSGNSSLIPLRGGCQGGNGGTGSIDVTPASTDPGGGGGGIQMVSNTSITLLSGGIVAANGGGGKGYTGSGTILCIINTQCFPGEGAGSGGGILLEAPQVSVESGGALVANGGGGSCGSASHGTDGLNSSTPANGGVCSGTVYGNGGTGGALGAGATTGGFGSGTNGHGGGGGGGVGRIRVNLPQGDTFTAVGIVSPAATAGVLQVR